tara:strand:- start:604 stop:822 length:219 start_codon:yes stop_codon:yes gene_type:complete
MSWKASVILRIQTTQFDELPLCSPLVSDGSGKAISIEETRQIFAFKIGAFGVIYLMTVPGISNCLQKRLIRL